ncbi:MAG: Uma2 family endonuclease [Myxococcota bacterium]
MKATLRLDRRATYADYLAVEQNSDHRHELIDGVIVAMAGGSDEHNAIAGRIAMLFGLRLEGPCRYYSPDQRFWIPASARGRYADGTVICGRPEHPPHDGQASTNPVVVVEVLSLRREGDDEGEKRLDFQSLTTLKAYVLVSQDARHIKVYRRGPNGTWGTTPEVYRGDESFVLPRMGSSLAVAEVYDNILDLDGASLLH